MNIEIIKKHINEHKNVLDNIKDENFLILEEISKIFSIAIKEKRNIFWCGNGGSSSDCQHLTAEFVGRFQWLH